jgi:hypothetical protein
MLTRLAIAFVILPLLGGCGGPGSATTEVEVDCSGLERGAPILISHGEGVFTPGFIGETNSETGFADVAVIGAQGALHIRCVHLRRPITP